MPFIKLKSSTNHFVSSEGYVFKTQGKKEFRLIPYFNESGSDVFVDVDGRKMNLLYIMIECFNINLKQHESLKYTLNDRLEIPLSSIITNKISNLISDEDYGLIRAFKCADKANGSNSRCTQKITPYQILCVLKINSFKCIYCNTDIIDGNWHLDHYYPISKGGKNVIGNLVSSCKRCNMMKSDMTGEQFYKMCKKITNNFKFKAQ